MARGIFQSPEEALPWILAGRVWVGDRPVRSLGERLAPDVPLEVRGLGRLASRGGLKLAAALDRLGQAVADRVALDCGASTGGFTDLLLRRGVRRVYAVDVGYGQLAGYLRQDPRVVVMERTNLSEVPPLDPAPDLCTLDLSYLSLKVAVPLAARRMAPAGEILALVKPLFEAPLTWPVRDPSAYVPVLEGLLEDLSRTVPDWGAVDLFASPVRGRRGTQEFWLALRRGAAHPSPRDRADWARLAVEALDPRQPTDGEGGNGG